MGEELHNIISQIAGQMTTFHNMLEERAGEIDASGGDDELVGKLKGGADAMRDSGNIYLSWARHYMALSTGGASEADDGEEDSESFQF